MLDLTSGVVNDPVEISILVDIYQKAVANSELIRVRSDNPKTLDTFLAAVREKKKVKRLSNIIVGDKAPAGGVVSYKMKKSGKSMSHRLVVKGHVMQPEEYLEAVDYMNRDPDKFGAPTSIFRRARYPESNHTTIIWRTNK